MINRLSSIPCDDERLHQLLGNELSESDSKQMERHLETCSSCQLRLESLAAEEQWWSGLPDFLSPQPPVNVLSDGELTFESAEHLINKYLQPATATGTLGRFGEYDVEEVIGAGAMGVVLKARDASLDRRVAIKVLSPHYADSESARRRFERESRSVAAVVHPHVVPIHAVDAAHELPYLVMAYVPGESLQQRITRSGPLNVKDILRIGMQTAQGLAAAHSQGIVHRDVKPANILLEDGLERVVLSDFGLARAIDDATMTRSGMLAGTPEYMSPEQAKGELVDHRSDLFSLGCVMYTMCTGQSPFRADSTMAVLKRICEAEPAEIREINDGIPVWFQAVIEKLLEKNPDDRCQSANVLARLLEQCLAHVQQPSATPLPREVSHDLMREQKRKRYLASGRRYWPWTIVGVATVICMAILAGTILQRDFRDGANDAVSATWSVPLLTLEGHTDSVYAVACSPDGETLASADNVGAIKIWNVDTGVEEASFKGHSTAVLGLEFSPDGALLASAGADGDIKLWDAASSQEKLTFKGHVKRVWNVSFSPNGKTLASCGADQTVRLWEVATGAETARLEGHKAAVRAVSFSPDGSTLASGGDDMRIRLWDVATGKQIGGMKWHDGPVASVRFNSDGTALASGSFDASIKLWDVAVAKARFGEASSLIATLKSHTERVASISFSPDDRTIASGSWDGTIKLWDVDTGEEKATIDGHKDFVWSVSISPDGTSLASASRDATVKIWELVDSGDVRPNAR